jgi:predicted site-specific integrase-resolvase
MKCGYARVYTDGQSVDAQVRQLTKAGCKKVFREVASGAKTNRTQLRRVLDQLEAGDVLTVTRLDRLARSTRDLLNTLARSPPRKPVSNPLATRGPTLCVSSQYPPSNPAIYRSGFKLAPVG